MNNIQQISKSWCIYSKIPLLFDVQCSQLGRTASSQPSPCPDPAPVFFAALLTPLLLACSVARLARAGPGLRQLQPAASCGRRLLAKTCLGWQPKDGPTSSTASAGGAQISEAKGSNKYLDNIYKAYQSKKHCFQ